MGAGGSGDRGVFGGGGEPPVERNTWWCQVRFSPGPGFSVRTSLDRPATAAGKPFLLHLELRSL